MLSLAGLTGDGCMEALEKSTAKQSAIVISIVEQVATLIATFSSLKALAPDNIGETLPGQEGQPNDADMALGQILMSVKGLPGACNTMPLPERP